MKPGDYPANLDDGLAERFLHHGVARSATYPPTDFDTSAGSVNSGTGAVTITVAPGVAYVTNAAGLMLRTIYAGQTFTAVSPGTLPASGKYASYGIEVAAPTTWDGAPASVTLGLKGADQNTQALAVTSPLATTSGSLRLWDVIIRNNAGVYSIVQFVDRRLRAAGFDGTASNPGQNLGGASTAAGPTLRVESFSSTTVFEVMAVLSGSMPGGADRILLQLTTDGGITAAATATQPPGGGLFGATAMAPIVGLTAGTHIFSGSASTNGSNLSTDANITISVRERNPLVNNGTT